MNRFAVMLVAMFMLASPHWVSARPACQEYSPAMQEMQVKETVIELSAGKQIPLNYRLADTGVLRMAGFQEICPETIQREQILFVFERPLIPAFHMRNVKAALDIAFIDAEGMIVNIQTMQPYVLGSNIKPLYRPPSVILYALEAREGFFAEHGIEEGSARFDLSGLQSQ